MPTVSKPVQLWTAIALLAVAATLWVRGLRQYSALAQGDSEAAATLAAILDRPNGFDLSNATISRDAIHRGGPPRDGIPAIDQPRFVSPAEADFLRDDDLVVSFTAGGVTRAYPLRVLVWHEIVNDEVAGQAIAVTYCPLCGTAMVFDRRVGERTLSFGVSGLLYQSDVLMYDRQTESLWSQLAMRAVAGPQAGTPLQWLPSEHLTWAAWKAKHPQGQVLSTQTGHQRDYTRDPYVGYEDSERTLFPVPFKRQELPKKAWVVGLLVNGRAKAYPVNDLRGADTVRDALGEVRIEISYDAAARRPAVIDAASGQPLPFVLAYWFAWQAFYPQTELWQP